MRKQKSAAESFSKEDLMLNKTALNGDLAPAVPKHLSQLAGTATVTDIPPVNRRCFVLN